MSRRLQAATKNPLAKVKRSSSSKRRIAGGTILSGVIGLLFRVLLGHKAWIARPLSVATSVALLALSASPFPPGERTAYVLQNICINAQIHQNQNQYSACIWALQLASLRGQLEVFLKLEVPKHFKFLFKLCYDVVLQELQLRCC